MITDTFEVHHTPPPLSFATFKLFSLFYYNNYKVHSTKMIMCTLDLISFIISYFQPNRLQFSVLCLSYPTRRIISRMPRQEINDVKWGLPRTVMSQHSSSYHTIQYFRSSINNRGGTNDNAGGVDAELRELAHEVIEVWR